MRYAIFSDIHSNIEAFSTVLAAYKSEDIDKYLCVGDIVGYATNPSECIKLIKDINCISIVGNHDSASVGILDPAHFNPAAQAAVLWTHYNISEEEKGYLGALKYIYENDDLVLAHGTLNTPERFIYLTNEDLARSTFKLMKKSVCFVGHTHKPAIFAQGDKGITSFEDTNVTLSENNKYIVNVGSVGQPRDTDSKAAYCVYDTKTREVQIKRIEYDISATQEKIIQSGLPAYLATRLSRGA